jgi:DHA2 family multidrug resistance protein
VWENQTKYAHAELAGVIHPPAAMMQQGLLGRMMIDRMVQTEAVTLATNAVFLDCAAIFAFAACFIWLAPKPRPRPAPASAMTAPADQAKETAGSNREPAALPA